MSRYNLSHLLLGHRQPGASRTKKRILRLRRQRIALKVSMGPAMIRFATNCLILRLKASTRPAWVHRHDFLTLSEQMYENMRPAARWQYGDIGDQVASNAAAIGVDYVRSCRMARDNWTIEQAVLLPQASRQGGARLEPRIRSKSIGPWPYWFQAMKDVLTLARRGWAYSRLYTCRDGLPGWRDQLRLFRQSEPPPAVWAIPDDLELFEGMCDELAQLASIRTAASWKPEDAVEEIVDSTAKVPPEATELLHESILVMLGPREKPIASSNWPYLAASMEQIRAVYGAHWQRAAQAVKEMAADLEAPSLTLKDARALAESLDLLPGFRALDGTTERRAVDVLEEIAALLPRARSRMDALPIAPADVRLLVLCCLGTGSPEWAVFVHLLLGDDLETVARNWVRWVPAPCDLDLDRIDTARRVLQRSLENCVMPLLEEITPDKLAQAVGLLTQWLADSSVRPTSWELGGQSAHEPILCAMLLHALNILGRYLEEAYRSSEPS